MTAAEAITVSAEALRALIGRMFTACGLADDAAERLAQGLVDADLEGVASHGVMLVDMYIERIRRGSVSLENKAEIISDRESALVLDAGHALGQLTGEQAMALAVERAARFGAAVVAVRHGFHFGTARRYALRAADAGCIGVAMCNTRPLMPAPGGAERLVGNNPIAIALPSAGPIPLVLDMATSEAAMGKIRMAEKAKEPIPDNWAVTSDGAATTDAAQAIAGMLLPSGGPKGFGLAFVIDLMCGLLAGGATGGEVQPLYGDLSVPYDCSHLFIAIDVAHFCDLDGFRKQAAAAAERVRIEPARARCRSAVRTGRAGMAQARALRRRGRARSRGCRHAGTVRGRARSFGCTHWTCRSIKQRKQAMPKREVSSDAIRKPSGVFSQATVVEAKGRLVFISGMTARRSDGTIAGIGDITEQTRQVCENIKAAVEAAGGTLDDVCRVDVYVRNMEHFDAIHKVRRQYFKPPLPASTMVEITKMTSPDYLIEINAIAVVAD